MTIRHRIAQGRQPGFPQRLNPAQLNPRTSLVLVPGVNCPAHTVSSHGREFHTSIASYFTASAPKGTRKKLTLVMAGRQTSAPSVSNGRYFEIGGYITGGGFSVEGDGSNEKVIGWDATYNVIGDCNWLDADIGPTHGYVGVLDGAVVSLWRDGKLIYTGPITWSAANTGMVSIGADTVSSGSSSRSNNFGFSLFALDVDTAISNSQAAAISRNPWLVFQPRITRRNIVSAVGGMLTAQALGTAQSNGFALPSMQVSVMAIGIASLGGSATAVTNVPLAAAGLIVTNGSAGLSATVTISAAALVDAAGHAGLSAAVFAQAAGAAMTSGNAQLAALIEETAIGTIQSSGTAQATVTTNDLLSATGEITTSGQALLKVAITLAAGGNVESLGHAALSVSTANHLLATGTVTSSGSAFPTVSIHASASDSIGTTGHGNASLNTGDIITGFGHAESSGHANLSIFASLTAHGFIQAMGSGGLAIEIPLSAFGAIESSGHAGLVVLPDYQPKSPANLIATVDRPCKLTTSVSHPIILSHEVSHVH